MTEPIKFCSTADEFAEFSIFASDQEGKEVLADFGTLFSGDEVQGQFTQHEELHDLLLSTGDAKLNENRDSDSYWGDGGVGKGKNMLGQILMQVREKLRN